MNASDPGVVRVVIADDHPVFRDGARLLLESQVDVTVVGEAATGVDAVEVCAALTPDVVLLDLHMDGLDGLPAIGALHARAPGCRVVVVTMSADERHVSAALAAGAVGYLLKDAQPAEIIRAVHAVVAGQVILSAPAARLLPGMTQPPAGGARSFPQLTDRELEILDLLAHGRPPEAIACHLGLKAKTVRNNLSMVYAKLHVVDRASAILAARDAGLGLVPVAAGHHPSPA